MTRAFVLRPILACPADLNGDGVVSIFDILMILVAWGPCPDDWPCPADIDGNGVVNIWDVLHALVARGRWDEFQEVLQHGSELRALPGSGSRGSRSRLDGPG